VSKVLDFNFCPLRRIRHPLNPQEIKIWRGSGRKNKNYCIQSREVYENKGNVDVMADLLSDICARSKLFFGKWQVLKGNLLPSPLPSDVKPGALLTPATSCTSGTHTPWSK
jgi:hypothetical protein